MEVSSITEQGGAPDAPVSLMEKYLNDPTNDYRTLKFGDVMDGTIMRVDRDEILVDIGSKSEGIVPAKEFWTAEAYHQDYLQKNPNGYTCHYVRPIKFE